MTRFRKHSRWIAPTVAAVVVGLTGCGSSPVSTSSTSPSGEAPGTAAPAGPQVIKVAGGAAPQATEAAADSKLAMWGRQHYVYEGTPPDLTAPAGSWFFAPGNQPSIETVAAMAEALGVAGDVTEQSANMGGGWFVGPSDYSGPTLYVGTDALQMWTYSAPSPQTSVGSGCAKAGDAIEPAVQPVIESADTNGVSIAPDIASDEATSDTIECDYVEPQPPTGILTADAAEAKARALFESLGIDLTSYEIEIYADDWSASVSAYLVLDGMRTNLMINAGYGADGALTWAGGFLATPQRSADYDRIGVAAAVERLNAQQSGWMPYGGTGVDIARSAIPQPEVEAVEATTAPSADGAMAPPATSATSATSADTVDPSISEIPQPCPEPAAADGAAIDTAVTDVAVAPMPCFSIVPTEVTLTNVRPSLEQVWAVDGTVWLLPGYAFDSPEGGTYTVVAVPDQYLEVTPPTPASEPATTVVIDEPGVTLPSATPDTPTSVEPAVPPTTQGEDPASTATPTS